MQRDADLNNWTEQRLPNADSAIYPNAPVNWLSSVIDTITAIGRVYGVFSSSSENNEPVSNGRTKAERTERTRTGQPTRGSCFVRVELGIAHDSQLRHDPI